MVCPKKGEIKEISDKKVKKRERETKRKRKKFVVLMQFATSKRVTCERLLTKVNSRKCVHMSTTRVRNARSRNAGDSIKAAKFPESAKRITGQELRRRQKAEKCS